MKKLLLMPFVLVILPFICHAQEEITGYVHVTILYKSIFSGNLQIRDEVCKPPRGIECEKARIRVNGDLCQQSPFSERCKEAKAILDSSFCLEGLIFDGRVGSGEKIGVWVCSSPAGFGNVSIRDTVKGSIWTNYPLLNNGSVLNYP